MDSTFKDIRSSQRNESINHVIRFNANKTTLTEFYEIYKTQSNVGEELNYKMNSNVQKHNLT
ncbi:hypothetical protein ACS0TY_007333 [Phlomoides rotata]